MFDIGRVSVSPTELYPARLISRPEGNCSSFREMDRRDRQIVSDCY